MLAGLLSDRGRKYRTVQESPKGEWALLFRFIVLAFRLAWPSLACRVLPAESGLNGLIVPSILDGLIKSRKKISILVRPSFASPDSLAYKEGY